MMQNRPAALGAALALLAVPVVLVPIEALSFYRANRDTGALVSSGERREYLTYVPSTYDGSRPVPLVISFHGAAMWGAAQRDASQWNRVADAEGFIVVYPSGSNRGGIRVWQEDGPGGISADVRFIGDLIDTLRATYNLDPARIYVNGLSNGGGMSFALSCRLSNRIAAVGTVGAAQLEPFDWCANTTPVPLINFHGTDDRFTPYKGGWSRAVQQRFPDVEQWTARWARRNRCAPTPSDSVIAADVRRRTYTGCADDASVVLYTIAGGGHTWPGGGPLPEWFVGKTTRSIDASREMWAFFRRHPLRHRRD